MKKPKTARKQMSRQKMRHGNEWKRNLANQRDKFRRDIRGLRKAIARFEPEKERIEAKVKKYKALKAFLETRQLVFAEHKEGEFAKKALNGKLKEASGLLEHWEGNLDEIKTRLKGPESVLGVKLDKIKGIKAALERGA